LVDGRQSPLGAYRNASAAAIILIEPLLDRAVTRCAASRLTDDRAADSEPLR
jgi:hypothetical protein